MLASATKVFETTRQPFVVLDGQFHVVAANNAFWIQFDLEPADTIGGSLFSAGRGEWNASAVHRLLEQLLPVQHEMDGFELIGEFSGNRRVLLIDARELVGDDHDVDRLILLGLHDVTDLRVIEALVKRTRLDLERSNRQLQEFAAVASHDLQEPLRKILAFGERLQARAGASLDDVSASYLTRMLDASTRMRRLIDDVLECSRLATVSTHLERVSLDVAVAGAIENISIPPGATMTIAPLPTIEADPAQMRQLFQNLLSNACKFRRGDVPLEVTVGATRPDGDDVWTITVADNGLGFEPQYADRVFTMFQRLHGRQFDGSGIGLAVCRRIVERHHGSIDAHGVAGVGASLVVRLPEHQHEEKLMRSPRPVTILIAEDDPDDRLLARDALAESKLANTVRFVEDGQELLDYLQRRGQFTDPASSPAPGLVLVDLNMPRMDGRTAIEVIKGDPALRHIPITVLTTSRADEDIFRSYSLGVNSYIAKPVSFDGLVQVMKSFGQYWFEIVELPA